MHCCDNELTNQADSCQHKLITCVYNLRIILNITRVTIFVSRIVNSVACSHSINLLQKVNLDGKTKLFIGTIPNMKNKRHTPVHLKKKKRNVKSKTGKIIETSSH